MLSGKTATESVPAFIAFQVEKPIVIQVAFQARWAQVTTSNRGSFLFKLIVALLVI
jgi:hypothetical protein